MDDEELWNLDHTFAIYILPRLEKFRDNLYGYPSQLTEEEWIVILESMIHSFRIIASDDCFVTTPELEEEIQLGLDLFGKWFRSLWS